MPDRRKKQTASETPPVAAADAPTPKRKSKVSVLERRLIDPFSSGGSQPIQIKDEGMTVRWINGGISGRTQRAKAIQGWEPVRVDELVDQNDVSDLVFSPDGLVRRGERGQEVLMKMSASDFQQIQNRKAEVLRTRQQSSSRTKEEIAQRAAVKYGDMAGDAIAGGRLHGEIIESTERIDSSEA